MKRLISLIVIAGMVSIIGAYTVRAHYNADGEINVEKEVVEDGIVLTITSKVEDAVKWLKNIDPENYEENYSHHYNSGGYGPGNCLGYDNDNDEYDRHHDYYRRGHMRH